MNAKISRVNQWKTGKGFFFQTEAEGKFYAYGQPLSAGDEIEFIPNPNKLMGENVLAKDIKVLVQASLAQADASYPEPMPSFNKKLEMTPKLEEELLLRFRDYQVRIMKDCREDAIKVLQQEIDAGKIDTTSDGARIASDLFALRCKHWHYFAEENLKG